MNPPFPSASLYVGDLASEISEGHLFEIFNRIGPVALIRVCRDAITRRSLGYAYVNYHQPLDAEHALETLNNSLIKGKPCRIMWSQRDPSLRKSGKGNIFIKNLDKSIDHKTLFDTFSIFGNILSCKVAVDSQNNSKGYGFVHYETPEMADKAIEKVNGMTIKGKVVTVCHFIPRKERQKDVVDSKFTNVFVKNLEDNVTEEKLKEIFGALGLVNSCVVMANSEGKSKCFGFVNFEKHEDAEKAIEALNGKPLVEGGKALYVGKALKKSDREMEIRQKYEQRRPENQGVNLYVKNLDDDIDDEKLKNEFTKFGQITSTKVIKDDKGNSKGYGFVCFRTLEEANKAVTEMKNKVIGSKPIYVTIAAKKDNSRRYDARMGNGISGLYPMPLFYQNQGYKQMMPRNNRWGPQYQPVQNYMPPRSNRHGRQNHRRYNRGREHPKHDSHHQNQSQVNASQGTSTGQTQAKSQSQTQTQAQAQASPQTTAQPQIQDQTTQEHPSSGTQPAPNTASSTASLKETLSSIPPQDHIMFLGEKLFPLISAKDPENAGKITGMLLERYTTPDELISFLVDSQALNEVVESASKLLLSPTS